MEGNEWEKIFSKWPIFKGVFKIGKYNNLSSNLKYLGVYTVMNWHIEPLPRYISNPSPRNQLCHFCWFSRLLLGIWSIPGRSCMNIWLIEWSLKVPLVQFTWLFIKDRNSVMWGLPVIWFLVVLLLVALNEDLLKKESQMTRRICISSYLQ